MFTIRQKLVIAGAALIAVLIVAVGYFGGRWLHGSGSEMEVVTEYALPDGPIPTQVNPPVRASVTQDTATDLVSDSGSGNESSGDSELITDADSTSIDEDLEAQLAALSDDEFAELAEALEQPERESSKYPAVPEGFPETPVWLKDYFDADSHAAHVTLYRVLIELWNRGDHDFTGGVSNQDTGRVYPIYPDVIYVTWDSFVREGPDGESIEVRYISSRLGIPTTVEPLLNSDGDLFTEEEIMSGAYKTKFSGIRLVEYDSAGYDPASVLDNY